MSFMKKEIIFVVKFSENSGSFFIFIFEED